MCSLHTVWNGGELWEMFCELFFSEDRPVDGKVYKIDITEMEASLLASQMRLFKDATICHYSQPEQELPIDFWCDGDTFPGRVIFCVEVTPWESLGVLPRWEDREH